MFKQWTLPTEVEIDGVTYPVNTDYRDILQIISIMNNTDVNEYIKTEAMLKIFYADEIPQNITEALNAMIDFISLGEEDDGRPHPKQIDWEQDYLPIVADINKVAGKEIRAEKYMHWFTFIAYFNGIGDGQLSQIVEIRKKLRKGKKLEKWEQEYYAENKTQIDFKRHYSKEEQDEIEEWNKILGL